MAHASKIRTFLPLASVVLALAFADQVHAGYLADWFGWGTPTVVTTGYAPGYGYYYAPTVSYRTLYSPVAVTSYRPVTACSACGGSVTSYLPVTTYVQRPVLQAYTSYQPVVAPAPTCGCASCGCATGGCATCGYSAPACSSCGAAVGPAVAAPVYSAVPSNAPALSYTAPMSSTRYLPTQPYSAAPQSYPVTAAYTPSTNTPSATVTYPAPATAVYGAPTYIYPAQRQSNSMSPTYGMPVSPSGPPTSTVIRPMTPTLAPPPTGSSSADIAPALPGPVPPTPLPPASATPQPGQDSAPPQGSQSDSPKTFEQPAAPIAPPQKPIPDNTAPPRSSGSRPPLDPNSRTASSMPMLRPGINLATPWPIAKTTAALMPIAPDEADGWHAAR